MITVGSIVVYQGDTGTVIRQSGDTSTVDFAGDRASIITDRLRLIDPPEVLQAPPTAFTTNGIVKELSSREGATVKDLATALTAGSYPTPFLWTIEKHAYQRRDEGIGAKRVVDAARIVLWGRA